MSIKQVVLITACLALAALFYAALPERLFNAPYSVILADAKGQLLQARIADDGQWRFPEMDSVPGKFRTAIMVYEDKRFLYHPGVDPFALLRAARQNITAREIVSGGSTLTMQTIRLARGRERTFGQKLLEMILAVRLELRYSKDEILALYASHAPFGGNVVGLDAAAWRYFGRSPHALSWGETACLAVLPNSPGLIHPGRHREILKTKRDRLLRQMCEAGRIDQETCRLAQQEPLPVKPVPLPQEAPHLMNRAVQEGRPFKEGKAVMVKTTVNAKLQARVNNILFRHHEQLKSNGINNTAALVMEIESGNVLAYIGNIYKPQEPELDAHVDVIASPRSPGSTLKPLLYAAMLEDGLILPATLVSDIPTQIAGYSPQNFDLAYDGAVPANKALARSLNVPAVKMLQQYRTERFHTFLKGLGVTTLNSPSRHYGLSMILGGGENTLWELAGIYSSLARMLNHYSRYSSRYFPSDLRMPNYIAAVKAPRPDAGAQLLAEFNPGAGAVYHMFQSMHELMRPGEDLLWNQFQSSQRIAWKTGTSFGFRDGWAIGLDTRHLVAVWVGNADGEGRPGLTGISTAAPILFEIFKLLPASPWFEPPYDDLEKIAACRKSGYRAGELCEQTDSILVPENGLRVLQCPYHQLIHLDRTGKYRAASHCEDPGMMVHRPWFVLPPAMAWYYKQKNADYIELPDFLPGCTEDHAPAMEMIYPKRSGKIYIPIELSGSQGKCVFEAAHRKTGALVYWHLDDQYIGTTRDFHQLALNPPPGKHLLVLTDENGERLEQPFEILSR